MNWFKSSVKKTFYPVLVIIIIILIIQLHVSFRTLDYSNIIKKIQANVLEIKTIYAPNRTGIATPIKNQTFLPHGDSQSSINYNTSEKEPSAINVSSQYSINYVQAKKEPSAINFTHIYLHSSSSEYSHHHHNKGHDMQCTLSLFKEESGGGGWNRTTRPDIFFLETACHKYLLAHQACAIESACRNNPKSLIVLKTLAKTMREDDPFLILLKNLPNFRVEYLDPWKRVGGTPLETWFRSGKWEMKKKGDSHNTMPYSSSDLSNAFRYLELYLDGGLYMDSDFITLKPLEELMKKNTVGIEIDGSIVNGAFTSMKRSHSDFIRRALKVYENPNWKGNVNGYWGINGPQLVTKILKAKNCQGFFRTGGYCPGADMNILPRSALYPITYDVKRFYNPKYLNDTLSKTKDSYAVHLWNAIRGRYKATVGEESFMEVIARKHCPYSYKMAGKFGYFY